jgi:hypothetical protein
VNRPWLKASWLLRTLVLLQGCTGLVGGADDAVNGAGPSSDPDGGVIPQCYTVESHFKQVLWPTVLKAKCEQCHTEGGYAQSVRSDVRVVMPSIASPDSINELRAVAEALIQEEGDGDSLLIAKSLGKNDHGGGAVLTPDSPEVAALRQFKTLVETRPMCEVVGGGGTVPEVASIPLLPPEATFRKFATNVLGRLPTAGELSTLSAQGEAGLDAVLANAYEEQAFLNWVREAFGDVFQTEKFSVGASRWDAINRLAVRSYPGKDQIQDDWVTNWSLTQTPMQLVAYVVSHDLPFTSIVTLDKTVVNPFTSVVYQTEGTNFGSSQDVNALALAQLRNSPLPTEGYVDVPIPNAGMLSDPIFAARWPSSPTNRNRGRANHLLFMFEGQDVLALGNRAIDFSLIRDVANPTMDSPYCNGCHSIVDAIAGGYQGWDQSGIYNSDFGAAEPWYTDMFPTGYNGQTMANPTPETALQWMGAQLANDKRFAPTMVAHAYRGLILDEVRSLEGSEAPEDIDAWELQATFLAAVADHFRDTNYNFKTVVTDLVKSPYFRGDGSQAPPEGSSAGSLSDFGLQHLLTPEFLHRKINALLGINWGSAPPNATVPSWYFSLLGGQYRIAYGGVDFDGVTNRSRTMDPTKAAVQERLAAEVACLAVVADFKKAPGERLLFPDVTLTTLEATGQARDAAIDSAIEHLHQHLFGDAGPLGEVGTDVTEEVLLGAAENLKGWSNGDHANAVRATCKGPTNWGLSEMRAVQSWTAVVAMLLLDPRFLLQ